MSSASSPAPPGAVQPPPPPGLTGSVSPTANPVPPSAATSPLGSIPQVGPGPDGRPVTPSEPLTGSLSSYHIVPIQPTADARVMSPTDFPNADQLQLARLPPSGAHPQHDPNGTMLCVGYTGACRGCGELTTDPAMCAGCGIYGHPWCIGLCLFQGYQLCPQCLGQARELHAVQAAHYWTAQMREQFHRAKMNAINAAGLTLTVSTAAAGGLATLAGVGVAAYQGTIQGVSAVPSARRSNSPSSAAQPETGSARALQDSVPTTGGVAAKAIPRPSDLLPVSSSENAPPV